MIFCLLREGGFIRRALYRKVCVYVSCGGGLVFFLAILIDYIYVSWLVLCLGWSDERRGRYGFVVEFIVRYCRGL